MELRLEVAQEPEEDAGESALWLSNLWEELTESTDIDVEQEVGSAPSDSKGLSELVALLAQVPVGGIIAVAKYLHDWAARTDRTVLASIDGDVIVIKGASKEREDQVIEAWLARHTPSA
jgi:hypothetical protein